MHGGDRGSAGEVGRPFREIERRLVDGVRSRMAAEAESVAEKARARCDAAFEKVRTGLTDGVAEMTAARADESAAIVAAAQARGHRYLGEPTIPDSLARLIIDLGDKSGLRQQLSVEEILINLRRRLPL